MTQVDNVATIKPQATQDSTLVSIIIPAYNTAPYIHRAIGSSLRQTHKNIEILIIDDGSTDNTLRVAEYFAGTDSRIRVFTQKNAGVSAARNHGIDEARGEYIYFLDSDDWLEDDAIETLLDAQREHPDCLICANYHWNVKLEGNNLFRDSNPYENMSSRYMSLKDIAETYCLIQDFEWLFHCVHAKLFHTPFTARFPEGLTQSEDAVFFMRYFMQSGKKAYYISKPILNVLQRDDSARYSRYEPRMLASQTAAYKILTDIADDEECRKLMLMGRNRVIYNIFVKAADNETSQKEIRRIKSALRESAWLTVKCRRLPRAIRLKTFLAAYAPVPVFKAFFSIWNFLKSLRGKNEAKGEIVPGWQDFPKAPGI